MHPNTHVSVARSGGVRTALAVSRLPIGLVLIALALGACEALPTIGGRNEQPKTEPAAPKQPLYVSLTDQDVRLADAAVQRALETLSSGGTLRWNSTISGNAGSVTPTRTYKTKGGDFCRVYTEVVFVSGEAELYEDTACRRRDGVWIPIR